MNIVVSLTTYTNTSPALSLHQVLRKLLASKNPDDLRAANRLIREMVRRVSWDGGRDNACILASWLAGRVASTMSVCCYTPLGIVITPPVIMYIHLMVCTLSSSVTLVECPLKHLVCHVWL